MEFHNLPPASCSFLQFEIRFRADPVVTQTRQHESRRCLQLVHQIFDVEVDCRLGDSELIGNLLVSMAIPNELEHLQLTGSKIVFAVVLRMLRELSASCQLDSTNSQKPDDSRLWTIERYIHLHVYNTAATMRR